MPEAKIAFLIRKMMIALDYLHNVNICHRDIKPENMMFSKPSDNSEIMLVDFGMSAKFSNFDLSSAVGTPYFMAPEVLDRYYSKECDI
jgi:serine/threonine protein kinase